MYLQDRTSDFVCICQVCFHIAEMASPRSTAGHRGYEEGTETMNNVTKLVKEYKACLNRNVLSMREGIVSMKEVRS